IGAELFYSVLKLNLARAIISCGCRNKLCGWAPIYFVMELNLAQRISVGNNIYWEHALIFSCAVLLRVALRCFAKSFHRFPCWFRALRVRKHQIGTCLVISVVVDADWKARR